MPSAPVTTFTSPTVSSSSSRICAARPTAFGRAPQGTQYSMRITGGSGNAASLVRRADARSFPPALAANELLESVTGEERELGLLFRPGVGEQALDSAETQPVGGAGEEPRSDPLPAEVVADPQIADVAPP